MRRIIHFLILSVMLLSTFRVWGFTRPDSFTPPTCTLSAPANYTLLNYTSTYANLSWSPVAGAVQYKVNMVDVTNGIILPSMFTTGTSISYLFPMPPTPNSIPFYQTWVEAVCDNGQHGPPSNVIEIEPIIALEDIPQLISPCQPSGAIIKPAGTIEVLTLPQASPVVNHFVRLIPFDEKGNNKLNFDINYIIRNIYGTVWFSHNGPHVGNLTRNPNYNYNSQSQDYPSAITYYLAEGGSSYPLLEFNQPTKDESTGTCTLRVRYIRKSEFNSCNSTTTVPGGNSNLIANDDEQWVENSVTNENKEQLPPTVQNQLLEEARIYPNPASDFTQIGVDLSKGSTVNVTIVNVAGRTVQTVINNAVLDKGLHVFVVDVSGFDAGSYYVVTQTSEGRFVKILLKQ